MGRNSASLGPIDTPQVGQVVLNTFRSFCATLQPKIHLALEKRARARARFSSFKSKSGNSGVLRPLRGRCGAAQRPQKPPKNPPTQPPKPEEMRGWGPLAGVKRASAFAHRPRLPNASQPPPSPFFVTLYSYTARTQSHCTRPFTPHRHTRPTSSSPLLPAMPLGGIPSPLGNVPCSGTLS